MAHNDQAEGWYFALKIHTNDNQVGDDLRGLNGLLGKKSICSSLVLRTLRSCQTVTRVVGSCAESPNRSLPPIYPTPPTHHIILDTLLEWHQ